METIFCTPNGEDELMELPPGYRFHPTDEELITHYLSPKVLDSNFCARAIGEVDFNKVEPWDLPWKAKMGEKEWYFFSVKDRKYPTGLRTNRATESGYWKATGKDREIYKGKQIVGMKKTLVFYKGRAPKGEKTNWVMHEYRLEGKYSIYNLPNSAKNDWVISRVFQKSPDGKKMDFTQFTRTTDYHNQWRPSNLPPLIDSSNMTCFSNSMEDHKSNEEDIVDSLNTSLLTSSSSYKPFDTSSVSLDFPKFSAQDSFFSSQFSVPNNENLQHPHSFMIQDESILRILYQINNPNMKDYPKTEFSQDTGMSTDISSVVSNHELGQRSYEDQDNPITSSGAVDFDSFWN